MRTKVSASVTAIALSGAMLFGMAGPATAAAPAAPSAASQSSQTANVTGTINQTIDGVGTFVGSFTPSNFSVQNGQLTVTGLVQGTLTDLAGVATPVSQTVTTTAAAAPTTNAATATGGGCDIVNLVLGPLHLDVLGLNVDLNQVVLDLVAQSGAGKLVGNLLCAVTGLLDGGNGLSGLANLLNRLLGL
ncbi:ABC transporter substrate-binding protein [Arthrobacter sp. 8AJ]|uniref:ABC transporter substrate-binding protein n=1 Tax=Arthrobacter sp. 8AJ TaxID=2653130 RepID=UPI0012F40A9D|nr:ABC transporter substrate-binding protein [Arthrobacter sp. 8AJ]VXC51644.1 ABC transporter substrate-binding protein [Arthrobacter sp. 8AJ]